MKFAGKVIFNTVAILLFFVALFFAGMAAYAAIKGLAFDVVWLQFIDAVRK